MPAPRPSPDPHLDLSRRERQALYVLYELGRATAAELHERLPDPPGYSTVRSMLRGLEEKGHVRHEQDGPRYVYLPTVPRERARRTALRQVLDTFFDGSATDAVAALLDAEELAPDARRRILDEIERARREGR